MATDPRDRLNLLFANSPRPAGPTNREKHFSEKELEQKKAQEQQVWTVPETAQYPRQIKSPQKTDPHCGRDVLTSSDDDDDYVSAFRKKPSMKAQPKPRKMPEPKAFGYPENAVPPKGPIEYIAKGKAKGTNGQAASDKGDQSDDEATLPSTDDHGNEVTGHFCQLNLAAKFPYKYMNDTNDRVSRHFFASNKFYSRNWDLYYLHPPFTLSAKPIVLVPFEQVQQLISDIGQTFKVPVAVPKFPFTLTFFDDGTPQPILLGKSSSRDDATNLQSNIPQALSDHGECPADATPKVRRRFEDFESKCQAAIAAGGKKSGGGRKKNREEDPLVNIKNWFVQLRRAQRYLGLRQKTGQIQLADPGMPWAQQAVFRQDQLRKAHLVVDPLDINKPAPFAFEKDPIIVAIDVESYERAHNLITEIGISTLDTLDLVGISPGENGKNWLDLIRSRHFRIKGREHLVNREFCVGYPDAFQFGKSEFVDLKEAVAAVDGCFQWPFSLQYKHASLEDTWNVQLPKVAKENTTQRRVSDSFGGVYIGPTNAEQDNASRAAIASVLNGIGNQEAIQRAIDMTKKDSQDTEASQYGSKERQIILVGHDTRTDVDYLRNLGSNIFSPSRTTYPMPAMAVMDNSEEHAKALASIIDTMDTAPLYRVLKEETQNRKLSSIMSDLGLPCEFPHNAGNDARYTLEAWVAMLIKARLKSDKEQKEDDEMAKKHVRVA